MSKSTTTCALWTPTPKRRRRLYVYETYQRRHVHRLVRACFTSADTDVLNLITTTLYPPVSNSAVRRHLRAHSVNPKRRHCQPQRRYAKPYIHNPKLRVAACLFAWNAWAGLVIHGLGSRLDSLCNRDQRDGGACHSGESNRI